MEYKISEEKINDLASVVAEIPFKFAEPILRKLSEIVTDAKNLKIEEECCEK